MHHSSQREITWATTAERKTRQFAVTHLYPRSLNTFSDTVDFRERCSNSARVASAVLEKSSNQPVLPHTTIVLNTLENSLDLAEWGVGYATGSLMSFIEELVAKNPKFHNFAQFWRDCGKKIRTVEALLLSYHSTARVVNIPTVGQPHLINAQVVKLSSERYLQFAFGNFACNLDTLFNLVKASFTNNPTPLDFGSAETILRDHYMVHCDDAIDDFYASHWPSASMPAGPVDVSTAGAAIVLKDTKSRMEKLSQTEVISRISQLAPLAMNGGA
ncbi:MAG: hypothetical protein M1835_007040 [Candelina submexicana]|nr:MAG: hypothetical protein M1835_007040 [Candelina submexicana]